MVRRSGLKANGKNGSFRGTSGAKKRAKSAIFQADTYYDQRWDGTYAQDWRN
jgi:hypothetical protein